MIIQIAKPQTIQELGKRANQEDALSPDLGQAMDTDRVFIVCDGVGGHEGGEVASNTVCQMVADYLNAWLTPGQMLEDRMLLDAIETAYRALDSKDDGAEKKMGTTLTFLCIHRGGVTVAYIGDSRVYHLRPAELRVCMQTRDHSLVYDLYQAGEISYAEMATHPLKNIITKAMKPGGDYRVQPDIIHITDVRPGDYFYLCSDGMLEQMTNEQLLGIFASPMTDEEKAETLRGATVNNNDNHTAVFFRVETVKQEPGDGSLFVNDEYTSNSNAVNIKPVVMDVELDADTPMTNQPYAPSPSAYSAQVQPSPYADLSRPPYPQNPVPGGMSAMPGGEPYTPHRQPQEPGSSNIILYMFLGLAVVAIAALLYLLVFRGSSDPKDDVEKNSVVNEQQPKVQSPEAIFNEELDEEEGEKPEKLEKPEKSEKPEKKDLTPEDVQEYEDFLKTGKPPVSAPSPSNTAPRVPFSKKKK